MRAAIFDSFPLGLVLVDTQGRLLAVNPRAKERLGGCLAADSSTCCDLICDAASPRLGGACLSQRVLELSEPGTPIGEVLVKVGGKSSWVEAKTLGKDVPTVLHVIRPADASRGAQEAYDLRSGPKFRIRTLGELRVEVETGDVDKDRLLGRPGQLLRFLVATRERPVASEQIAEALWPSAPHAEALTRVRQYVHQLRLGLERDRRPGTDSPYVLTRPGGYSLARVWVDADELSRRAQRGLNALASGFVSRARSDLYAVRDLYRGDFLAEDPYADWALTERDHLRELRSRSLRALIQIELDSGRFEAAADRAREATLVDPFDVDVWRLFLELCLQLGRRSEAARQYSRLCTSMRSHFGEDPGFKLSELSSRRFSRPHGSSGVPERSGRIGSLR